MQSRAYQIPCSRRRSNGVNEPAASASIADSICLFDRTNGLLFTGDTYYPGPIYIFGTDSDTAAFQKSIERLANFTPQVHMILGGHNVPVALASILPELPL